MEYTTEPWHAGGYEIEADDGSLICNMSGWRNPAANKANARRIVACVNACKGIKTEDLESVPDFALMGSATIEKVEQQRDELLEALKAMLTHMGMDEDEWNKPTFDQARAAIAKAEQ